MRDENYQRLMKSRKWRRLRAEYLGTHPLCEDCAERDVTRLATEVHHVTPVGTETGYEGMRRLAYDPRNFRALCHECHEARHKEMESRSGAVIAARTSRKVEAFAKEWLGNADGHPGGIF